MVHISFFFIPLDSILCENAASVENFSFHYKDGECVFLGHNLTF